MILWKEETNLSITLRIFRVEASRGKVKHCGLVPLTQSEAGACDQENFVETQSVMIGKIVAFWRVKMQIWLVNECLGTLGTAVKEVYFALPMSQEWYLIRVRMPRKARLFVYCLCLSVVFKK